MPLLAASFGQVVGVVVVVLAVLALMSWLLKRRRSDVWRELAKRRGLNFDEQPTGPRISGQIDGRQVDVRTDDSSSDHDVGGVAVVRLVVALVNVPGDMTAEGVPGLIGDLAALVDERIELADEPFNRDVLVQGTDENRICAYWNAERRRTFLRLVDEAPCDQIAIVEGSLIAELRDIVSDHRQLERLLDLLLGAAPTFDANSQEK